VTHLDAIQERACHVDKGKGDESLEPFCEAVGALGWFGVRRHRAFRRAHTFFVVCRDRRQRANKTGLRGGGRCRV
jgi:hypothetical protein